MPIDRVCIVCGKHFVAEYKWGQVRATCSKECRYASTASRMRKREIRHCLQCGRAFSVQPSYKKTVCSPECRGAYMHKVLAGPANPNWKETKSLRPSTKRTLRERINWRDKMCQDCGGTKSLQVHHLDSDPTNNHGNNLILLCKWCHAERHRLGGEPEVARLILSNRTYPTRAPRTCPVCGKVFQSRRRKQITCSPQCGKVESGRSRHLQPPPHIQSTLPSMPASRHHRQP